MELRKISDRGHVFGPFLRYTVCFTRVLRWGVVRAFGTTKAEPSLKLELSDWVTRFKTVVRPEEIDASASVKEHSGGGLATRLCMISQADYSFTARSTKHHSLAAGPAEVPV